jgi:hypothetical protein
MAAAIAVALAAAACTTVEPVSDPPPAPRDADGCPSFGPVRQTGRVRLPSLDEISGIVAGPRRGTFWVQEDSGNPAAIAAIDDDGRVLTTVAVRGARNEDWEDIARTDDRLWIADIGDNAERRPEIRVYSLPEPTLSATSARAEVLRLRYEDDEHDAEALLVTPDGDALYVITKELSEDAAIFGADISSATDGDRVVLRELGSLPTRLVTGADLGSEGIVIVSYLGSRWFPWTDDRSVEATLAQRACRTPVEGGEAIAIEPGTGRLVTVPEGIRPPITASQPDD